jgi:hypothetical protein
MPAGQTRDLLDERPPAAAGVVTEKPAHAQLDYRGTPGQWGVADPCLPLRPPEAASGPHVAVNAQGNAVAVWWRSNAINTIVQAAASP